MFINPSHAATIRKHRIAVLISGNGSNLQALMDAVADGTLANAEICLVISNNADALGLTRARRAQIPTQTLLWQSAHASEKKISRNDYDQQLAQCVLDYAPEIIVLAGFLHILSAACLSAWRSMKVINLHPALPHSYIGLQAIERAYADWKRGAILEHGVMVHEVSEELDRGKVIDTQTIETQPNESLASFAEKMHLAEHQLIVRSVKKLISQDALYAFSF